MRRALFLGVLLMVVTLAALAAYSTLRRNQATTGDREFGIQADRVRQASLQGVEIYDRAGQTGKEPTSEEIRSWRARMEAVDNDARRAALGLSTVSKRELALRWLFAHQDLRATRSERRAIEVRRVIFNYCLHSLPPLSILSEANARLKHLNDCYGREERETQAKLGQLDAMIERLLNDTQGLWARLLAIAPDIAR